MQRVSAYCIKRQKERTLQLAQITDFKNEYTGLTSEKAAENIKLYGYNSDTKLDEKTKGYSPARAFFNLRFVLLLAAAVLSFFYGEIITAIVLVVLCGICTASDIIVNTRCDEYFFQMKRRSKTEFRVVRNGEVVTVRREQLVPDDILILSEGESVPADAHLLEIHDLTVDESIFTENKTPVTKITGADSLNEDLKKSCIYKGTKIVSGRLAARVTATGVDTKAFKTFGAPAETEEYYTALEKLVLRTSNVFNIIAAVMLVFGCLFNFTAIDINNENPILNTLYNTLYPAIAFALCFIPAQTLSMVRLYYIKGAKKIESKNVVIKNLKTIEHINAVTCVCIDKSGTVTKNRTEVADELTANSAMLTNISVLACQKNPTDPIDQAIILNAAFKGADPKELHENQLIKEYPFDEALGAAGNLWNVNGSRLLCIKGAPEKLLPLCDVPGDMLYTVQNKRISYGNQGYNVLAVAFAQLTEEEDLPEKIDSTRYSFMGLIAFDNPTRDYIPAAIRNCYKTGIRVVMLTGDSPETAGAVAAKIGIKEQGIVTGDMLSGELPDLKETGVFARLTGEQRSVVIKKLKEAGEIVAITGESASDSNILELADVGISLARNVSGAAFEVCDIMTGDDSFETAVDTMRSARQIHGNVKRCISASLTGLVTIILFAVVNLVLGSQFILSPVLATIISAFIVPAAAYMFIENTADLKTEMSPSVYIGQGVLRKRFFIRPLVQALGIAAAEVIFYLISSGYGVNSAETVSNLTPQSSANFLLIFVFGLLISCWVNLSEKSIFTAIKSGQSFAGTVTGILVAAALVLVFVPFLNTALGLASVDLMMVVIALVVTVVSQLPAELMKLSRK